ncbi:hypothetical protein ABBQ32_011723 [Trebouxia sp. C0010 RCD-2024]
MTTGTCSLRPSAAAILRSKLQAPGRTYRLAGRRKQVYNVASSNGKDMVPPFNVVITGSTKGIGKALATNFVRSGDNVVICSRSDDKVRATVSELSALSTPQSLGEVKGRACNMTKPAQVASLADFARDELGSIDLWINNAGSNGYKYGVLGDYTDTELIDIVETNVLGVMLGCREAIRVMKGQPSGGHIFNMDGAGADGGATPRFAAYGASKRGLAQLGKSLQAELKMSGITNVGMHNLSPGMVTTDLLMSGADTKAAKFFINCLAEETHVVADALVPRIRKIPYESKGSGGGGGGSTYIRYLTKQKAYTQILGRLISGRRKNRFVQEE